MRLALATIATLGVGACARADIAQPDAEHHGHADARGDGDAPSDLDAPVDAPAGTPDAQVIPDAPAGIPDAMTATAPTLLLSEVSLAPTAGELIEIINPTDGPVNLHHYYLTDVPTYFRFPAGTQTIDANDFIAQFPAGATIAAGAVITISLDTAANYQALYTTAPTYSITGGTMIVTAGSGASGLTNGGEPVVLFTWDGASDLVSDCDIMIAGAPSAGNALVSKSGIAIDGPDAGTATTAYATDAGTIASTPVPASGKSIKRILFEAGHETQTGGGNGITGDDETSEQTGATWDSTFTPPTPGTTTL